MKALAKHVIAEYYGCDPVVLDDPAFLEPILAEAARVSNATVMDSCLHKFSPQGVSGVLILAESHLAVHTWPEHSYAAVEIFTCGDTTDPEAGHRYLLDKLKPSHHELKVLERGDLQTAEQHHDTDKKAACIS